MIDVEIFDKKAPPFIKKLAGQIKQAAIDNGIDDAMAAQVGMNVSMEISDKWGGLQVYIPADKEKDE